MILEGRKMIPSAFLPSTGSGQAKHLIISFLVFSLRMECQYK
jgi:hypothetical protein